MMDDGADEAKAEVFNPFSVGQINSLSIKASEDSEFINVHSLLTKLQVPHPVKNCVNGLNCCAPWIQVCESKVVKYDLSGLHVWKALFAIEHSILSDTATWKHLSYLCVLCVITFIIVWFSDSYKSLSTNNDITARAQLLIELVLVAYITIVINRWDRIRNQTLHQMWAALEELSQLTYTIVLSSEVGSFEERIQLTDKIIRYCRLCIQLTFLAAQGESDLSYLVAKQLLTEKEQYWLQASSAETRPLVVAAWMQEYIDSLRVQGFVVTPSNTASAFSYIAAVRSGVGTTLSIIQTQLPIGYVHMVHWIIQIMLAAIAIQTGVIIAVDFYVKNNGDNGYVAPNGESWPQNPNIWYSNSLLTLLAGNVLFALFAQGLLRVAGKLHNPMSKESTSFSEHYYDALFLNNCIASRAGMLSFRYLN